MTSVHVLYFFSTIHYSSYFEIDFYFIILYHALGLIAATATSAYIIIRRSNTAIRISTDPTCYTLHYRIAIQIFNSIMHLWLLLIPIALFVSRVIHNQSKNYSKRTHLCSYSSVVDIRSYPLSRMGQRRQSQDVQFFCIINP